MFQLPALHSHRSTEVDTHCYSSLSLITVMPAICHSASKNSSSMDFFHIREDEWLYWGLWEGIEGTLVSTTVLTLLR